MVSQRQKVGLLGLLLFGPLVLGIILSVAGIPLDFVLAGIGTLAATVGFVLLVVALYMPKSAKVVV
jgi:hypothetical protein